MSQHPRLSELPEEAAQAVAELADTAMQLERTPQGDLDNAAVDQALTRIAALVADLPATQVATLRAHLEAVLHFQRGLYMLVREHKEEIRFTLDTLERLRRERADFFARTLGEVAGTLRDTPVTDEVAADWVRELTRAYVASLDVSAELVRAPAFRQVTRLGDTPEEGMAEEGDEDE